MTPTVADFLPDLLRVARATTSYPVTLRPDEDEGGPLWVFEVRNLPWGDFMEEELKRVVFALSDACNERNLPGDFVVVPEDVVGEPPLEPRRRHGTA